MPFTNWLSNDANRKSEPGTKLAEKEEEKNNYIISNRRRTKNKRKEEKDNVIIIQKKKNSMLFSPYIAPTIKNGFKTD